LKKIILLLSIIACACPKVVAQDLPIVTPSPIGKQKLTEEEKQNWQHKDILEDSIPGVSLDKAYREILSYQKAMDTVIIAVIDTRIDIDHKEFKNFIWNNNNEIPDNNIDDDNNGYIDDIHGWNFLANKNGDNISRLNFSFVRYVRKYKELFQNKTKDQILAKELYEYNQFLKAKEKLAEKVFINKDNINFIDSIIKDRNRILKKLAKEFPNKIINSEFLKTLEVSDSTLQKDIKKYNAHLRLGDYFDKRIIREKLESNINLNVDFDEIKLFGDDVNDIKNRNYGNNNISSDIDTFYHSTQVTGVIIADRKNTQGILGVINSAKIMPVCIAPIGDERDKDIALGIRYAVDNGANIINITFTKSFPINNMLVVDALKYAAKNDVLIVSASGNDYMNLDVENSYPNDSDANHTEFIDNFIKVGASWFQLNEKLVPSFSNYGTQEVDIFAPGKDIYTTQPNQSHEFVNGTSFSAPIVAGVAALIRSYYPNLSAAEVKEIIMESGVSYNLMVNKPSRSKEKELVPFSSLSKSGKIVNAYNALLMAEEVSKKKK
jgi:subtilisin family serine protease